MKQENISLLALVAVAGANDVQEALCAWFSAIGRPILRAEICEESGRVWFTRERVCKSWTQNAQISRWMELQDLKEFLQVIQG